MSLSRRLLLSYLALLAVTASVLVVAADTLLRRRLTDEATVELQREARYLAAAAARTDGTALDSLVHRLGGATGRRLTLIAPDGRVIADTDFPRDQLATLENHAGRPEVRAALAGRTGVDLRTSTSTGRPELKVAVRYAGGVARVSSPLTQVDAVVHRAQGAVLLAAIAAALVAVLLAFGFAVNVARPLVRLRDAALAITRGEHPHLDARGRHEVGELARAIRTMDETLGARLAALERERSEVAALIGSMVEGVVACDAHGTVATLRAAARALLGLAPGDTPPPAGELFLSRPARETVDAALAGRIVAAVEAQVGQRFVLLSGHPLAQGGAVFVIHDVTDLKRLEAVRRDFVANVSHELKTPLTVIRGYAETLLKDDLPGAPREQFLRTMLENARRMQRLVDDLLDLSRIESGAWRPAPADAALEPVAREVWASLTAGGRGAGRALVVEAGVPTIRVDPEALRHVLANVLDNALNYTPEGGRITVRTAAEPGAVRLEVSDTGTGIGSEHLSRVFERFYRADPARSREAGGTGLGLAIAKHLVEAHGGRVEALSTVGRGTTIFIVLPKPQA
jgi:two-component system phosphate regulon sensor histidine kinase PhoR